MMSIQQDHAFQQYRAIRLQERFRRRENRDRRLAQWTAGQIFRRSMALGVVFFCLFLVFNAIFCWLPPTVLHLAASFTCSFLLVLVLRNSAKVNRSIYRSR